jgi:hypothetical protein
MYYDVQWRRGIKMNSKRWPTYIRHFHHSVARVFQAWTENQFKEEASSFEPVNQLSMALHVSVKMAGVVRTVMKRPRVSAHKRLEAL